MRSRFINGLRRFTSKHLWIVPALVAFLVAPGPAVVAAPAQMGDLDEDGQVTVLDLVRLLRHVQGVETLSTNLFYFADIDEDGFISSADSDLLANGILGLVPLSDFPLTQVRDTSPENGESDVALTRETIFRFNHPLAAGTVVSTNIFYAEVGVRRLLSRAELSSDRQTLTLFYLENLPAGSDIEVTFDSSGIKDLFGNQVDGNGDGFGAGRKTIKFTTSNLAGDAETAVIGRVLAAPSFGQPAGTNAAEHPLAGVRISVDGMEETLFTVTDAQGNFRLEPAPVGRFFVHIDGRTATESRWPAEPYYPYVGKAWETVAGIKTNLAGGNGVVYLPLITAGTLQPVSTVADTSVTFPASVVTQNPSLAGVTVTVPANSLYSDNGTRGGKVGIAPVPPDRLPSPLPPGLNFPVVITVQTDGASNFDRPAPARFPNLPDPVTGRIAPPGSKSALWSFNHDTGEWEVQGQMTVSADGRFVETDPGVGIRQPGWHGNVSASSGKGGKIKGSKPKKPCQTNGEPCDDGDDCTTNDRCQGGICRGDYPQNVCPGTEPFTPIHFRWKETINESRQSYTLLTDFDYDTSLCYDPGCRGWRMHVTSMDVDGVVNLSNIGSTEPNPVVGGNVSAGNYCEILNTFAQYIGNGRGKWHLLEATRVHEYYHRDVELPDHLWPFWQIAENTIESYCIPCKVPQEQAGRMLSTYADAVFDTMQANFWAQQIELNKKHNEVRNDPPYQAGQKVLDVMAAKVRAFAAQQGFGTCPIMTKPPNPVHLVRIETTVWTTLIDVGQGVQIQVLGIYSDGSTRDLTLASTETTYRSTSSQKATVSADGLVRGVTPGRVTIVISHPSDLGLDSDPVLAAVTITVRSPDDLDNDGLPNDWEKLYGLNPNDAGDANQDRDGDGLSNSREFMLGTDPNKADTDGDGTSDGTEVLDGTEPTVAEFFGLSSPPHTGLHYFALLNLSTGQVEQRGKTDSNGQAFHNLILAAGANYRVLIFQPKSMMVSSADFISPGPGLTGELPAFILRKDMSGDSDQDGLSDVAEFILGSDARLADSDGDGVPDGMQLLPDQFTINIGDTVGNGVPAAGAGKIERPRSQDVFTFTATPGQFVFLELLTNTIPCCVDWQMQDEEGDRVFAGTLQEGNGGRIFLKKGGVYTLTVGEGGTNQTGSYQFKLWDVVPQEFAIKIGDAVSNGVPAPGAGNLEIPGALDIYTFTARPKQQVYFDFKEPSPNTPLQWLIEDENGYVYSDCVRCLSPGVVTLIKGGTYHLTMGNGVTFSFDATPADTYPYEFKIWDVPPADSFPISIGDVVRKGVPGPGAGAIETPGVQDIYTFTAAPGQQVFFHVAENDFTEKLIFIGWKLEDQDGNTVFSERFMGGDPGVYTLTRGGTYTITVDDRTFFTAGEYEFQTWNVPSASQFSINLGDTVQDGKPGAGAGRIETPGSKDIYTFTAAAGSKASFKVTGLNPSFAPVTWRAVDEAGTIVFDSCLGCTDPGTVTLSRGGTYTITVGSDRDPWVGTYQFETKAE